MPAPISVPRAVAMPCLVWRDKGNSPLPKNRLLEGQWQTAQPACAMRASSSVTGVDIVRQYGPLRHQAIAFINLQIILAPVKVRQNRFDFVTVFVDMGLQIGFWMVVQ